MSLLNETLDWLTQKAPHEEEYLQAVQEVCQYIVPIVNANESYKANNVLRRLLLPQNVTQYAVEWENDNAGCEINTAWRVQHNNVLGPYKGGTRFHPSLNLSILKFLAFEQSFKNALTGLSLGSAKGGADFDPKGRSENEIRRFCKAYIQGLHDQIGTYTDVPAGDINVSSKELGYMYGEHLKKTKQYSGALSGKPISLGGSELRTEATGFGIIYFLESMLEDIGESLVEKTVSVSGAGNVALHAGLKAVQKGAKVITLSNSRGTLFTDKGLTEDDITWLQNNTGKENALKSLAERGCGDFENTVKPWSKKADIAIPCATQNEIDENDAELITSNISLGLVEGANMPCTNNAIAKLLESKLLYAPGKAANAGGVVLSAFEMQQNTALRYESREDLDARLKQRMQYIHSQCLDESNKLGHSTTHYLHAANVAGFRRLADAMVAVGY